MAYVKLAPLAIFFLATFLMSPMKNVEAQRCSGYCKVGDTKACKPVDYCHCVPTTPVSGSCKEYGGPGHVTKMVGEHPNLCESHADCMKKESGSFCSRYPDPDIKYGWCFASESEAERYFEIAFNSAIKSFFKIRSNSEAEGYLKMAAEIAT